MKEGFWRITCTVLLMVALSNVQAQIISGLSALFPDSKTKSADQHLLIGLFDNQYHTMGIDVSSSKATMFADVPFLIVPNKDSLLFAFECNRQDTFSQPDFRYYDTDTNATVIESDENMSVVFKKNINDIVAIHKQFPTEKITEDYSTDFYSWLYQQIYFVAPPFLLMNEAFDAYTGGAHPNHGSSNYGLMLQNILTTDSLPQMDETTPVDYGHMNYSEVFSAWLDSNLYEVQRYLYFKGIAGFWDDSFREEDDTTTFRLSDYDGREIGDEGDNDFYIPNIEDLNYLVYHAAGQYKIMVQAFAFADYASSGDYQFTVSKDLGALSNSIVADNDSIVSLAALSKCVAAVYDFYLSNDKTTIVLLCHTATPNSSEIKIANTQSGKLLLDVMLNTSFEPIMITWISNEAYNNLQPQLKNCELNFTESLMER